MAITHIAQQAGSGGGAGPHSITYPSTTVDDVIIVFCGSGAGTITWDTGVDDFTEIYNEVLATNDPRIGAAYHVIDGDESASFTIEFDTTPGAIWIAAAMRGVDTSNIVDVVGTAVSSASTETSAHAGVTTGRDGNFVLYYGCKSEAAGSPSSVDNGFTEANDSTIGSGGSGIAQNQSRKELTTAGAVGTTTISWAGGLDRAIAQMISINAAIEGGYPYPSVKQQRLNMKTLLTM